MSEYDILKLENQLCFPLYVAAKEVVRLYNAPLAEIGLTYTQYIALMALWEDGSMSVKALCEKLYLDTGTVTPLLKSMEKKDLVTRRRNEKDERSVIIGLSDKGLALREKALGVPARVGSCIPLSREDAEALYRMLYKLIGELK